MDIDALDRPLSRGHAMVRILRDWLLASIPLSAVVCFCPDTWPRWGAMWLIAIAIFAGLKWLTWSQSAVRNAAPARHLGYLLAWPGLDVHTFLGKPDAPPAALSEWLQAFVNLVVGGMLVSVVARRIPAGHEYLIGWVGMIGIVLVLHFGSLHLVSCGWRLFGVHARPLMNAPIRSVSLDEFWGRRWNTAFRDLTASWKRAGYHALTLLFLFFTVVYGWAAFHSGP
jgi:hypothetical protein